MKNFDQFIGVDWSGAKAPINTKSIAVASVSRHEDNLRLYPKIRSRKAVADFIEEVINQDQRTLIGIDCNFGYAHEIVQKQIGAQATAFDLWARVDEVNAQNDNFFAGNFWQHDTYAPDFWTAGKIPEGFQMPKRMTEITCAENGYGRPESPFKLIGAKQVGKGGLAGMRMAHYLKKQYGDKIAVYPFESDKAYDMAQVVITEIYPRQFIMRTGFGSQKVRNADDLNEICRLFGVAEPKIDEFTDHDTDALVSAAGLRFLCGGEGNVPHNVSNPAQMNMQARQCEGWIFGVGDKVC